MNPIEIRTGSDSDIPKIRDCYRVLHDVGLSFSPRILSAHRTPDRMVKQAGKLVSDGFLVSIAAAGGSAHLPGMTSAETTRPVIGIPVRSSVFGGLDSLLSIIQMPEGVPTGSVGIGDAANAGLCAAKTAALQLRPIVPAIRSFMGLPPADADPPAPGHTVVLVDAAGPKHGAAVASTIEMLRSFGLQVQMHTLGDSRKEISEQEMNKLEAAGVAVVVVLCDVMDTGTVPATIGAKTHLPVVGLPLLQQAVQHKPEMVLERLQEYLLHRSPGISANGMVSMGINRTKNAALFALQIAAIANQSFEDALLKHRKDQYQEVLDKDNRLLGEGIDGYL